MPIPTAKMDFNADSAVCEACTFALREYGIDRADVLATLLFGSRGRGISRPESDVDLIFLVRSELNCPDFSYRRLYLASQTIDSNVMKAHALDGLCRSS